MSNSWEEREKAFEEGYFKQKDNELIAKMRAKIAATAHPEDYDCPKCDGKLQTGNFEKVQVDICDKCGGMWFDAGEIQHIVHKENESWLGRLFS
ncbi:MAG: zf-TFIIB domain-containing protein [Pyrinomonadaceae bacterium]